MLGEAKQPPRAAVSDRDREDAGVLRGGGVDEEAKSGKVQGEILGRLQLSGVPGAERPSKVKDVEEKARGFLLRGEAGRVGGGSDGISCSASMYLVQG